MEIPVVQYNKILFLGFRFEAGDFLVSVVSVYAYCDECPYPELMESIGVTGSISTGPETTVLYSNMDVSFIVEQTFSNDTLCGLSAEYDYLDKAKYTVFPYTCSGDSYVSPGNSKVYMAPCKDGFVDIAIYAYDPDFEEGNEVFAPSACVDTPTSTKYQKEPLDVSKLVSVGHRLHLHRHHQALIQARLQYLLRVLLLRSPAPCDCDSPSLSPCSYPCASPSKEPRVCTSVSPSTSPSASLSSTPSVLPLSTLNTLSSASPSANPSSSPSTPPSASPSARPW